MNIPKLKKLARLYDRRAEQFIVQACNMEDNYQRKYLLTKAGKYDSKSKLIFGFLRELEEGNWLDSEIRYQEKQILK